MVHQTVKHWWIQNQQFYANMRRRHRHLWVFIEQLIKTVGFKRVLEVGGGAGEVSEWLKGRYTNIERNAMAIAAGQKKYPGREFIEDDFMHMDTRQFQDYAYSLVLACGVIEHCSYYRTFLHRAVDTGAHLILVTFFRGLWWRADRIVKVVGPGGVFYENHY
ncbi:unnamed protein product, partial [marine sediment metagenome]